MKTEQAEAWSKWRAANLSMLDMDTITDSRFVENRLWNAFMAGYEAGQLAPWTPPPGVTLHGEQPRDQHKESQ